MPFGDKIRLISIYLSNTAKFTGHCIISVDKMKNEFACDSYENKNDSLLCFIDISHMEHFLYSKQVS